MAGYHGFSKSNNAVHAEQSGLMVASKLARAAAGYWPRLRGLTAADVEAEVSAAEWHHTSKMYNAVNYYDFQALKERGVRARLYRRVLARRAAKAKRPVTLTGCTVKWIEWGGTRSRPTATEMTACGCTCTFKPASDLVAVDVPAQFCTRNAAGQVFEHGAESFRKRLTTNGFFIRNTAGRLVRENPCG
jgi:hypothetical protein